MSNSFFFGSTFFQPLGKTLWKVCGEESADFQKRKDPRRGQFFKTPANRGNSRQNRKKRGEKTDFQPSAAVLMTKGPLEHSENAGNPFLCRLKETR